MIARLLLIAAPMFVVAPSVFINRSATPKMLSIIAGLYLLLKGGRLIRKVSAFNEALVFFMVCCLSWVFAADKLAAFTGAPKAPYYGLFGVALVVLAYISSAELGESSEIERDLEIAGAAISVFALAQVFFHSSLIGVPLQGDRASGFRLSPVMFAAGLVPCFLASWHRLRSRWWLSPWPRFIPMALMLGGMVAARAPGAAFALVIGLWVYETSGPVRWLGALTGMAAVHLYIIGHPTPNSLERLELTRIAWYSYLQHPLLGWGPDNFLHAMMRNRTELYNAIVHSKNVGQASAHWDIAQIAATLGSLGLVAYFATVRKLLVTRYDDALAPAALVAILAQAQVNPIPTDLMVLTAVLLGSRQLTSDEIVRIPDWVGPLVLGIGVAIALQDLAPLARSAFH